MMFSLARAWMGAFLGLIAFSSTGAQTVESPRVLTEVRTNLAGSGAATGSLTRYQYDDKGNRVLKQTIPSLDTAGKVSGETRYQYDGQGRLEKQTLLLNGKTQSLIEYYYSGAGFLITSRTSNDSLKEMFRDQLNYNAKQQLVETRRLVANELTFSHRFGYDAEGRIVADTLFEKIDTALQASQIIATGYDSQGRPLGDTSYLRAAGRWFLTSTLVRGWQGGVLASLTRYEKDGRDHRLMDSTAYAYDGDGRRTREEAFDDEGIIQYRTDYQWTPVGLRPVFAAAKVFRIRPIRNGFHIEGPGRERISIRLFDARGTERHRVELDGGSGDVSAPRGSGRGAYVALVVQGRRKQTLALPLQ